VTSEAEQILQDIYRKYQDPYGILVWGYTATGDKKRVLVDDDGRLQVDTANPPNLDVALSTRASETTAAAIETFLDELTDALASVGTDTLRTVSV